MSLEKLYFDNSTEYLLSLNSENNIENVSHALIELLGKDQENIFGLPFLKFISEDKVTEAEKFLTYGRTGEKQDFTWKINGDQSKIFRFKLSMRSRDGMIIKLEDPGALNNKWGKKLANEQILQLFLNLVPFPLFVKNRASEYIMLNQAQADLYGISMSQLIGKSDQSFITDENELELVNKSDEEVFNSFKKTVIKDQQFTTPNGKMYILETIKVPFINDVTGEINILGVSIDNTERKQAEAKLLKTNIERDNLLHKVTEQLNGSLQPVLELLSTMNVGSISDKSNMSTEMEITISKMNVLMEEMSQYSKN